MVGGLCFAKPRSVLAVVFTVPYLIELPVQSRRGVESFRISADDLIYRVTWRVIGS